VRLNNPLDGLLFSQGATRLLRVLAGHPERRSTSNELARMARTPTHRALEVLRRFELEGIVRSRVVGRAYQWEARPDHPLFRALRSLFRAEAQGRREAMSSVVEPLTRGTSALRIVLFGSAARGDERAQSDVDLLIVVLGPKQRAAARRAVALVRENLRERYGTRVRPIIYTRAEYERKRGSPLLRAIEREGRVLWPEE